MHLDRKPFLALTRMFPSGPCRIDVTTVPKDEKVSARFSQGDWLIRSDLRPGISTMDFSVCRPQSAEHSIIHRQPDRFASWVFNGGLWQFVGDEIVIGFGSFKCAYDGPESVKHASFEHGESSWQLARSTDGGRTWEQRDFVERSDSVAAEKLSPYSDPGEPVSFTDSDLLLCHRDDLMIHVAGGADLRILVLVGPDGPSCGTFGVGLKVSKPLAADISRLIRINEFCCQVPHDLSLSLFTCCLRKI